VQFIGLDLQALSIILTSTFSRLHGNNLLEAAVEPSAICDCHHPNFSKIPLLVDLTPIVI
jgi:hypothetical protein